MRICQLIILSLPFFLQGCGSQKIENPNIGKVFTPAWLKIPTRYAFRDKDDNYLSHPFFDAPTGWEKERRLINYFVTTPMESPFKYELDLFSGRLYKEHDYCPVDDIWEAYRADVDRPNFTEALVPRMYDEHGEPQRLFIFARSQDSFPKLKFQPAIYDQAKLVGSIIVEGCENFPCDRVNKWKPTQILLAVNPRDSYANLNTITELKSKIDWPYFKAMVANQNGVHSIGKNKYPAFRISKELGLDDTQKYLEAHSKAVNIEELTKWREGCFKIYDNLWEKSEKIRKEKIGQQDQFLKLFKEFFAKDKETFYQCQKLVRAGNINEDVRRQWFFAFIFAYINLDKNGFYFSCGNDAWAYNPKVDDSKYYNDPMKELERCRAKDFEKSFDQAINGLSLMKNQINKTYRFVEYDSGHGGSHQKIYAWIPERANDYSCKYDKKSAKENQFDLFPQDVVWESFAPDSDKLIK